MDKLTKSDEDINDWGSGGYFKGRPRILTIFTPTDLYEWIIVLQ